LFVFVFFFFFTFCRISHWSIILTALEFRKQLKYFTKRTHTCWKIGNKFHKYLEHDKLVTFLKLPVSWGHGWTPLYSKGETVAPYMITTIKDA
jgi:hypothetical protein